MGAAKRKLKALKMHGFFASCALTALLLAAAWADHHGHHDHHDHHDHDHHSHEEEMKCHMLSNHNADFGFALYRSLNAKAAAGKNIFYSPLGISAALSMLATAVINRLRSTKRTRLFSTCLATARRVNSWMSATAWLCALASLHWRSS